jgi:hypothetical protein
MKLKPQEIKKLKALYLNINENISIFTFFLKSFLI